MKFNSVTIKNFRNFEDISIDLTNKNVLFGMNDVGKTNFLYALRFSIKKLENKTLMIQITTKRMYLIQ